VWAYCKKFSSRELVDCAESQAQEHGDNPRVWHDISNRLERVEPLLGLDQLVRLGVSFHRANKPVPRSLVEALMKRVQRVYTLPEHARAQVLYIFAKAQLKEEALFRQIASTLVHADLKDLSLACSAFSITHMSPPHSFLTSSQKLVRRLIRKQQRPTALFVLDKLESDKVNPKHIARVCALYGIVRYEAPSVWWEDCAAEMLTSRTEALVAFALSSALCKEQPKFVAHECWNRIAGCCSVPLLVKLARALHEAGHRHRIIHKRLNRRLFAIFPTSPTGDEIDSALDYLHLPIKHDSILASLILESAFCLPWTMFRRVKMTVLHSLGFGPDLDFTDAYTTDVHSWPATLRNDFSRAWNLIDKRKGKALHADTNIEWIIQGKVLCATNLELGLQKMSATEIVHLLRISFQQSEYRTLPRKELWKKCTDKILSQACPPAVDRLIAVAFLSGYERDDFPVPRCSIESYYASLPRLKLVPPAEIPVSLEMRALWRRFMFDGGNQSGM